MYILVSLTCRCEKFASLEDTWEHFWFNKNTDICEITKLFLVYSKEYDFEIVSASCEVKNILYIKFDA